MFLLKNHPEFLLVVNAAEYFEAFKIVKKKKKTWYIYTMEYYQGWERRKPALCNNMDGPWGNCTKWNKPDRERQHCMVSLIYGI